MTDLLKPAQIFRKMAKESGCTMDSVVTILEIKARMDHEEQAERRSSPEERGRIDGLDKVFDEKPDIVEASPKDLARELEVRPNQGNLSRIIHKRKQYLLTHKKAAE